MGPTGTREVTETSIGRVAPSWRVTSLRVCGTGRSVELPTAGSFTLGRRSTEGDPRQPRADVRIPSARNGVSLLHATFEWRDERLWCRDRGSTNGTYANDELQRDCFVVASGMRLDFGEVRAVALDARLAGLCAPLAWCLGLDAFDEVDRAIRMVVRDNPLLLTGPRNCDQEWLARRIHEASTRRMQPFTALTAALPRRAEDLVGVALAGTVFIDLATAGKMTAAFATALFGSDPSRRPLRPIVAAPSHRESQRILEHLSPPDILSLPPVSTRRAEVPRLLDHVMEQNGSAHRVRELDPARISRLVEHPWPNNLLEVRQAALRICALLESGNVSAAARCFGSSRQSFAKALARLFQE